MTSLTTTIHRLLASVGVVAVLATGCATGTAAGVPDADDPAPPVTDGAADPDLDTGDDPDGGVIIDPDETDGPDDDQAAADDVDTEAPSDPPSAKPPAAKPAAKPVATPAKPATGPAPKPAPKPAPEPVTKPAPAPTAPAVLADGTYEGRLVRIDRRTVAVDLVQVLSGEAARKAAAEAGELPDDGTLPNDVYVKDLAKRVTVPVAGDGGFQVYDCSGGCELVGTTLDALVDGTTMPYGGPHAPFTLRVDHGEVVSLVEIYLP